MIVVRMGAEMLAELIERRRTQNVPVGRQMAGVNQPDEGTGNGAVTNITFVGARNHHENVDAIIWKVAEGRRIGEIVEAALDAIAKGEIGSSLRVEKSFPGPGEDLGIVAADLEDIGFGKPFSGIAAVKQSVEGLAAPGLEGVEDVIGVGGFGVERIVQKMFEIPVHLAHKVGIRLGFGG